jgi:hypothetical protein
MVLERDEFVVAYDPVEANEEILLAAVKRTGYLAQVKE